MKHANRYLSIQRPWHPREEATHNTPSSLSIRVFEAFTRKGAMLIGLGSEQLAELGTGPFDFNQPEDLQERMSERGGISGWVYYVADVDDERVDLQPKNAINLDAHDIYHIRHFDPQTTAVAFPVVA